MAKKPLLGHDLRKVQPKLRMIANGSLEVNQTRADFSSSIRMRKSVPLSPDAPMDNVPERLHEAPRQRKKLRALAKGVENALLGLGIPRERRPFRGHITLGRFQNPQAVQLPHGHSFGAVRADRLVLYRSTLSTDGATYEVLEEMSLGAGMTPGPD